MHYLHKKENDNTIPIIELSNIRVPVYQTVSFDITDYIDDDNWITDIKEIYIDTDLETDSNLDWNSQNDKDVIVWVDTDENYKLDEEEGRYILTFGWFESIFEENIKIYAIDYNNNVWEKEIVVSSYAPTPEVTTTEDNKIEWEISEDLTDQNITLFRYRLGNLEKINNEDIQTDENWNFEYSYNTEKWVEIKVNNEVIANVDEETWFITFTSSDYNIENNINVINVENADKLNNYPLIVVTINWEEIYESYFVLPDTGAVNMVDSIDTDSEPWAYVELDDQNNYSTYSIPITATYNPWAIVIYSNTDVNKEPLFIIYRDWRIETKDNNYTLSLEEQNKHFVYVLKYNNNVVAKVLLQVEDNYILNK